jgi:hypothetical protein
MLDLLRRASGSTLLTMLVHAMINFERVLEIFVDLKWLGLRLTKDTRRCAQMPDAG